MFLVVIGHRRGPTITRRSSAPARTGFIRFSVADCVDAKGKEDWVTLDNCQLVPNKANDGDSFHIRANETEYLVRLYFVDAPETANLGPARLIEQAEYFGVSVPQVIEIGRD